MVPPPVPDVCSALQQRPEVQRLMNLESKLSGELSQIRKTIMQCKQKQTWVTCTAWWDKAKLAQFKLEKKCVRKAEE